MTDFVESLHRLYNKRKIIKIEQLNKLLESRKISKEEFEYITRKE